MKYFRTKLTSWCIAKPSTDNHKLNDNIDYSCKQNGVDCTAIAPGGKCFSPNNPVSHASMAMNLYYKAAGKHAWNCHFNGTGMIVLVDPCKSLMLKYLQGILIIYVFFFVIILSNGLINVFHIFLSAVGSCIYQA